MTLIEALAQDAVLFAFFSAVAFIAGYTLLANWWKSQIGWARISLDFGIALALSPTAVHVIFGTKVEDSATFAWYTICAIVFVGLVSLWNLAIVVRAQLKRRRRNGRKATHRDHGPPG